MLTILFTFPPLPILYFCTKLFGCGFGFGLPLLDGLFMVGKWDECYLPILSYSTLRCLTCSPSLPGDRAKW